MSTPFHQDKPIRSYLDVTVGRITIFYSLAEAGWILPGGKFTEHRHRAYQVAQDLNQLYRRCGGV
jgi:hypothetical protein